MNSFFYVYNHIRVYFYWSFYVYTFTILIMKLDPLKTGFYCVDYVYNDAKKSAVYFQLESAQEALVKMVRNGVECTGMREWKPKPEIMSIKK
jgi:hypothetical protein